MLHLLAEEVVSSAWWVPVLGTAATLIAGAIAYAVRALVNYLIKKMDANEHEKEAYQVLLEGMAKVQENFVREAKAAATDGKLTKSEVENAKVMAWTHAKEIAKGPVKDIVLSWSKERVSSYIKQFLSKTAKAKGATNGGNS